LLPAQALQIKHPGVHLNLPIIRPRPLVLRAVDVQFQPVAVRVGQVERLADAVIGRAIEPDLRRLQPPQGVGEGRAGRVADGDVVEAGRPWRGRRTPLGDLGTELLYCF